MEAGVQLLLQVFLHQDESCVLFPIDYCLFPVSNRFWFFISVRNCFLSVFISMISCLFILPWTTFPFGVLVSCITAIFINAWPKSWRLFVTCLSDRRFEASLWLLRISLCFYLDVTLLLQSSHLFVSCQTFYWCLCYAHLTGAKWIRSFDCGMKISLFIRRRCSSINVILILQYWSDQVFQSIHKLLYVRRLSALVSVRLPLSAALCHTSDIIICIATTCYISILHLSSVCLLWLNPISKVQRLWFLTILRFLT